MKFKFFHTPALTGFFALGLLTAAVCAGLITPSVSSAGRSRAVTPETDSIRVISLPTNDIVFNPLDQQLYASIPSSAGVALGNRIARISPHNGIMGGSVYVGSEPTKLVLTAGNQLIYVHLDGAFAIRKYDTTTQTPGTRFSLGQLPQSYSGLYTAKDFVVAPDDPELIAVARYFIGSSPPQGGVAIYKNGVRLSQTGPGHSEGAHYLAFSASGSTLYGTNDYGVKTMTVTTSGVTVQPGVISAAAYSPIKFDTGKILSSQGQVIDTASGTLLGTLPGTGTPAFVSDVAAGRAYYLVRGTGNNWTLKAYDLATFTQSGSLSIPNVSGDATSLVRWGTNGLAFRTTGGQLFLVQTSLIPTENPLPEPPPLPTPSPSPTPTVVPAFLRRLQIPANDAIFSGSTNSVLVAVPGSAGTGLGNTITHVNPISGQIQSSVFIGSEPNKLALSDDGLTLYSKLDGANAIRRYNVALQTAGLQFPLPAAYLSPREIEVKPGQPDTIAVAVGYDGVAIFDNGVMRPIVSDGGAYAIDTIEFSSNPEVLYGYDQQSSGWELIKFTLTPQGVSGTLIANSLISGYYTRMKYSNGLLYATSGRVVNPETTEVTGTYQVDNYDAVNVIDSAANRIYFLSGNVLSAFDRDTFVRLGSITLPQLAGTPAALSRWGANGFLIRTVETFGSGSNIYLLQTALVNDEVPVPVGMHFASATVNSSEANPSLTINVTRSGDTARPSTVNYATQDGTATAGTDYVAQSGTLSFVAGQTSLSFAIPIINDNVYEGAEAFSVVLSSPGGEDAQILSPSMATITVIDNEQRPTLSNNNASVIEPRTGNTLQVDVPVNLSHPSVESITVNFATSDVTATAGSDYVAASGTITFAPLETAKTIPVQILGDSLPESEETFRMTLSSPTNATILVAQSLVTIRNLGAPYDFDGDRKSDVGIFRPSVGEWWIYRSSDGQVPAFQFGGSTDTIVPADFTGDGKTDIAFWRPSTGEWFVVRSEDNTYFSAPFGASSDIPVPADYDADGKADVAVFRPSDGNWYVQRSSDHQTTAQLFGQNGDQPIAADYDGDGRADVAIYRPSVGEWWLSRSTGGVIAYGFGDGTDKIVPGDYTGDGKADVAFWRPATGEWFILRSEDMSYFSAPFGANGDIPAPGDYDGDGKFDVTVFRPSSGTWFINRTSGGTTAQGFGSNGDRPLANAYVP